MFLNLRSNLPIFFLLCNAFDVIAKKTLPNWRWQIFSLVFSSRSSIALTAIFRPSFHLELIFVYWVKYESKLVVFLKNRCLIFQHFVEDYPLPWQFCWKSADHIKVYLNSIPLISKPTLIPIIICLGFCNFTVHFEIG